MLYPYEIVSELNLVNLFIFTFAYVIFIIAIAGVACTVLEHLDNRKG